jgi:prepilin-type N-terminal cleavage/methylation domain-containing protein
VTHRARSIPKNASRRGFTVLELATVAAVTGILAASAIPAFRTLSDVRAASAAAEVRRTLQTARGAALAATRPTGVSLSTAGTMQLLWIPTPGATPEPAPGPLGSPSQPLHLPGLFTGVGIASATSGKGQSGTFTLWFDHEGVPHARSAAGTRADPWTTDATITLTGGTTITVRRFSGVIE